MLPCKLKPFFRLASLISDFLKATQLFSHNPLSSLRLVRVEMLTFKHSPEFYCCMNSHYITVCLCLPRVQMSPEFYPVFLLLDPPALKPNNIHIENDDRNLSYDIKKSAKNVLGILQYSILVTDIGLWVYICMDMQQMSNPYFVLPACISR